MNKKALKALKIIFVMLSAVATVCFVGIEIMKLPMNSDSACMLLEAEDILSGNIFLSDWHLTGISFLTTDLPWFVLGTAVFGVSLNAFRLTVFLMYIVMAACAAPLVFYKVKDKFTAYCVFLGVGVIPTTYALSNAFVHTAGFALSFLIVFAAVYYDNKPTKGRMTFLTAVCALGVCGDRISLMVAVVPILAVCLLKGFKNSRSVALVLLLGSFAGIAAEKLWLLAGGADYNSVTRTNFAEIGDIPTNFRFFTDYFLRLINAYFFSKELFSVKTVVFALKILVVLFAFYCVYRSVKALVKREKTDTAVASLGIGFLLMAFTLIITTMNLDLTAGRYIAYLPLFISVVLAHAADKLNFKCTMRIALCALFLMFAAAGVMPHGSEYSPYNAYSRLAFFLESENLTNGYASFWDSTIMDVYSEGRVHVSPVKNGENGVEPRLWFCKNSWYEDKNDTFFVVRTRDASKDEGGQKYIYNGIFNVHIAPIETVGRTYEKPFTYESIIETFGQPKEIKQFEYYDILVYDRIEF